MVHAEYARGLKQKSWLVIGQNVVSSIVAPNIL